MSESYDELVKKCEHEDLEYLQQEVIHTSDKANSYLYLICVCNDCGAEVYEKFDYVGKFEAIEE